MTAPGLLQLAGALALTLGLLAVAIHLLKRMQQGRQWYVVPVEGMASAPLTKEEDSSEEEEVIPDPED